MLARDAQLVQLLGVRARRCAAFCHRLELAPDGATGKVAHQQRQAVGKQFYFVQRTRQKRIEIPQQATSALTLQLGYQRRVGFATLELDAVDDRAQRVTLLAAQLGYIGIQPHQDHVAVTHFAQRAGQATQATAQVAQRVGLERGRGCQHHRAHAARSHARLVDIVRVFTRHRAGHVFV